MNMTEMISLIAVNNAARGSRHKLQLGRLSLSTIKLCSCVGGWWSRRDCPGQPLSTEVFSPQLDKGVADVIVLVIILL